MLDQSKNYYNRKFPANYTEPFIQLIQIGAFANKILKVCLSKGVLQHSTTARIPKVLATRCVQTSPG